SGIGTPGGAVVAKLRQTKRLTKHEVDFLKQHAPGDIKMTLPTANQFPALAYKKGVSERAYPTYSEFLWDIVPIIKAEIHALVDEGIKYIQIDAPRYSYYIDPKWRRHIQEEMGLDPEQALDEAIRADNACLEGAKREGVILAMHLCRGNNRSQWYAEGGYDPIAERLFNQINVDVFLLEYESERAGTFEALRSAGVDRLVAFDINTDAPDAGSQIRERARQSNTTLVDSSADLARASDIVFSTVTSSAALDAARQTAPFLEVRHIYADLNSVSPALKQEIARVVGASGARFVEVAVMAPVLPYGHRVPMLLGGPAAPLFLDAMAPFGLRMQTLAGAPVGAAAAVKMCRSIVVKGLVALMCECVLAASRFDADAHVFASLNESFPGIDWKT